MLGPFPGMDPYLEEPDQWPDVHATLIGTIRDLLAAQVAPSFIVRIEQRVYIASVEDISRETIAPDVYIVEHPQRNRTTTTTLTASPPILIEPLYEPEVHDRYIEILDARNRELVTTIELLSPANKAPGSGGRAQFLKKRRAVLSSPTHWIEIDLLRGGERPKEVAGRSDYYVLLRRADDRRYAVWYSNLRDQLPSIAVPLLPPHPDAVLDLQATLNSAYERAFYALSVDYTRPVPPPPLLPPDAAWVAARVREWRASQTANLA
jgi:hypothetical protein